MAYFDAFTLGVNDIGPVSSDANEEISMVALPDK